MPQSDSPVRNQRIKALVFDAYGTLFDVHSVVSLCDDLFPGQGAALSRLWRAKQLEYTWLRSLMDRYEDFWHVTESALVFACKTLDLPCDSATRNRLMDAYLHLQPFSEVVPALDALSGYSLAVLSNGSPKMLEDVLRNCGLREAFAHVISVDEVKIYKPSPRVYHLAVEKLDLDKTAIGFVSSNCWDAIGAKAFGFRTFWVTRTDSPEDELGFSPDRSVKTLAELPELLK